VGLGEQVHREPQHCNVGVHDKAVHRQPTQQIDFGKQQGIYILYDHHTDVYVGRAIDRPLNDPVNERQKRYLEQLFGSLKAKAADLAQHWSVSPVTAKRDSADLKERGLIEFVGSPKTGWYQKTVGGGDCKGV
jgi:hypothetical protein